MTSIISTRFAGDQYVEYISHIVRRTRILRECDCCGRMLPQGCAYLSIVGNAGRGPERRAYCLECDGGEYSGMDVASTICLCEYEPEDLIACENCGDAINPYTKCYAWSDGVGREVSPHYCCRECANQNMEHGTTVAT